MQPAMITLDLQRPELLKQTPTAGREWDDANGPSDFERTLRDSERLESQRDAKRQDQRLEQRDLQQRDGQRRDLEQRDVQQRDSQQRATQRDADRARLRDERRDEQQALHGKRDRQMDRAEDRASDDTSCRANHDAAATPPDDDSNVAVATDSENDSTPSNLAPPAEDAALPLPVDTSPVLSELSLEHDAGSEAETLTEDDSGNLLPLADHALASLTDDPLALAAADVVAGAPASAAAIASAVSVPNASVSTPASISTTSQASATNVQGVQMSAAGEAGTGTNVLATAVTAATKAATVSGDAAPADADLPAGNLANTAATTNHGPATQQLLTARGASFAPAESSPLAGNYSTTVDANVDAPEWGDSVAGKVVWMVKQKLQMAELHLNPAELGPVDVKIQVHHDQSTTISFNVQNSQVRDLLEQHAHRLRDMLQQNGVNSSTVDVSSHGRGEQGDERGRGSRHAGSRGVDDDAPTAVSTVVQPKGLVDDYA